MSKYKYLCKCHRKEALQSFGGDQTRKGTVVSYPARSLGTWSCLVTQKKAGVVREKGYGNGNRRVPDAPC